MRQTFHETGVVTAVHKQHVDIVVGGRSAVYRQIPIIGGADDVEVGDKVSLAMRDGEMYAESTRSREGKRMVSKLAVTGTTPPGSDHCIIFNNDGAWGAEAALKWDNDNDELEVDGDVIVTDFGHFGAKYITIGDETQGENANWPSDDVAGITFYDPAGGGGDLCLWVDFDGNSICFGGPKDENYTQGNNDVIIGWNAANNWNKGGSDDGDVVIGHWAMYGTSDYTGEGNVAIGAGSCYNMTSGSHNMVLGHYSGFYLEGGSDNVVIGHMSLFSNQTASANKNVIIGKESAGHTGSNNPTGCIYIGYRAGRSAGTETRILRIENQNATDYAKPLIYGEMDADTGSDSPPFVAINYDDKKADAATFVTRAISGAVSNQWEQWTYSNNAYASIALGWYDFGDDSDSDFWLMSRRYTAESEDPDVGSGSSHRHLAVYNYTSGGSWNEVAWFSKKNSYGSFSAMWGTSQAIPFTKYEVGSNQSGAEYTAADCSTVPFICALPEKPYNIVFDRVVYSIYRAGTHNASNRFKWKLYCYDVGVGGSTTLAGWHYSNDADFSSAWGRKVVEIDQQINNTSGNHAMVFIFMDKDGTPGQMRWSTPWLYVRWPK